MDGWMDGWMDVCMYVWYNLVKKQTQQTKKRPSSEMIRERTTTGNNQVSWHRFLGIFPDTMEYPTILSPYHSSNMDPDGFLV